MTRKSLAAAAALLTASLAFRGPPDASYPLPTGELHAVAVSGGMAAFDLPFATAGEHYLLVVSSLAGDARSREIALESRPVEAVERVPLRRLPDLNATAIDLPPATGDAPRAREDTHAGNAPSTRTFWLNVAGGADDNPAAFRPIHARLADEGRNVRVYVDGDDAVDADATAAVVEGLDHLLGSSYAERVGRAPDVDGDGKLAVVLTSWLSRMQGGTVSLGGLVQPRDFDPLLAQPQSNRADVLLLNANVRRGTHLRNLLAHEYAHAVLAGTRNANRPGSAPYEESWLDEAIAHRAEMLGGEGWSNLDYRLAAFLAAPNRAPLAVADYQAAGLWRAPGPRGHTFLFLHWCGERYGPGLLPALIDSHRRGRANVQAATGAPFDELFRRFSADLVLREWLPVDEREKATAAGETPSLPRLTEPLGGWPLSGPRREGWELAAAEDARFVGIAGTSSAYYLLSAQAPGARRLTIRGPSAADLQVTLVRMPDDLPRLTLRVVGDGGARRIEVTCRGGRVTLEQLAWGVASFSPTSHAAHAGARGEALSSLLGELTLASGGRLLSHPVDFSALPGGEVYVSAVAVDEQGRRVTAWTSLDDAATPLAGL